MKEFVGVFEEILKLIPLRAEGFSGELGCNLDPRDGGIFCHIANFVDLDAGFTGKGGFQLFGERRGLCVAAGKSADETGKLWLR